MKKMFEVQKSNSMFAINHKKASNTYICKVTDPKSAVDGYCIRNYLGALKLGFLRIKCTFLQFIYYSDVISGMS